MHPQPRYDVEDERLAPGRRDLDYLLAESARIRTPQAHKAFVCRALERLGYELRNLEAAPTPPLAKPPYGWWLHGTDRGYWHHRNRGLAFPEDEGGVACGCRRAHAADEKRRRQARAERVEGAA